MRIGNPTNNELFLELNKINEDIQNGFLKKIIQETRTVECNVMLGDSTTKNIKTFDIKNVESFFGRFQSGLSQWNSQGITYSSDEDLRRIFTKSEIKIGNYIRCKFIEIIIVWITSTLLFSLLGLNYALLLGFLCGISVIIPYV
ncbi:MAG: AI-2E family transporter, partial [Candidatus Nitrosopelagicus sp.]|nr:AI-2E family transporter [Candidatus Nitrosopelagicus sp.]